MIKVLLADDHSIVRAGLRRIIEESGDMAVTAEAENGRVALREAARHAPDIAVVDISMPDIDGLEVITRLHETMPDLPILVLTMHEERQYVVRAIEAGAMGYITKQSAPEQLVRAVRRLIAGHRYLSEDAVEVLALRVLKGDKSASPIDALSMRELQVLRRLAMGQTNREIAEAYGVSVKTVDTYRHRLLKKLDLRNNAELSRFAIQNKLVEL
ncbi:MULTISPECIES: response regulator [Desulfococcus]|uniref:Two component transcriptional regulator, LuxR family n=1 Tax=Desulfococcus multivorans DSM 2059 TaxID=1121405 RepID=S7UPM7_DESML|nr:response regulator transcription factor [Desulfococcus multivorans]AOY59987.1 two component system response regulator, LuxR-type [Desulfococcus multivorans]AQV02132.1 DNA-binding response regulator [Desulfococcus multivorans]EPR35984.1 two component transcriptional regulator, LuxR family [Desulfococcus multivorans DSM 2059]SJZ36265.1 two component transcriptional regulator, LuxR family [Desulfococcus multivorans DSM 2059]